MASPDDGVGRRAGNGETPRIVRSPWTVRVAAWSARHRWLVFVLCFAATFGTLAAGFAAGGINALDVNDDSSGEKVESDVAYDVLGAGEPVAPSERFVVVIDGGPEAVAKEPFQAEVHKLVKAMTDAKANVDGAEQSTFDSVIDPFLAPPQAGLISPDGTTVQVVGNIPGERDVVEQKLVPIPPIVATTRSALPNAQVHVISSTFINKDITGLINDELDGSLRVTIPLTFLILLAAFGAIVATVIPLLLAITSLAAAYGFLALYSQVVGAVSPNATQLIVLMGLAVAVDYSLFMITRFRTERRRGASVPEAIETSSSTAGRAVFFSGIAVVISLGGLVTRLPVGFDHHGRTAGPTFELFYGVDYLLPHRDAAWAVMEERMRVLAELATRCRDVCSPLYLTIVARVADDLVRLADRLAEGR